jgi:hypothetical protein
LAQKMFPAWQVRMRCGCALKFRQMPTCRSSLPLISVVPVLSQQMLLTHPDQEQTVCG